MQNVGLPEELFQRIEAEQTKFTKATGGEKPKWKIIQEWMEMADSVQSKEAGERG
jgi:hypothetical protein